MALVACRFYAFRPYLDHPHLFRQADTAFFSLGFYRFGMNIFTPSVGWMGDYRRVVLEFPLTEWLSAALYFVSGPTILVDRLVTLAFFLGSAWFLFRIVGLVHNDALARFVTVVYLAAPLGIYYSRAVHIDFTAVCLSHALLFFVLRFARDGRARDLATAAAAGSLAFAVKAPYAFYLLLPALLFCYQRRATLRAWLGTIAAFAVSTVAFAAWFAYSQAVNRRAPDLSFIPSYFAHVNRFSWYFGTWEERLTLEPWRTIAGRIFREIATTVWWAFVPLGFLARRELAAFYAFSLAWCAGTIVYVLLFLSLNESHNYYQVPFIAPFALLLGGAIYACWTYAGARARLARAAAVTILLGYAVSSFVVAAGRFYRVDAAQIRVGEFVRRLTTEDDLIVMAHADAVHGDPSYLFYARRYGWSVGHHELSPRVLDALARHGATAVVTSTTWPPREATQAYLRGRPQAGVIEVEGGEVTIHRLAPTRNR
jgi:hypothetical protein